MSHEIQKIQNLKKLKVGYGNGPLWVGGRSEVPQPNPSCQKRSKLSEKPRLGYVAFLGWLLFGYFRLD